MGLLDALVVRVASCRSTGKKKEQKLPEKKQTSKGESLVCSAQSARAHDLSKGKDDGIESIGLSKKRRNASRKLCVP